MGLLDNIANTLVQDVDKLLGVTPKPLSPGQKFVQDVNAIGPIYPAAPAIPVITPNAQNGTIQNFWITAYQAYNTSSPRNATFTVNYPGRSFYFRKNGSVPSLRFDATFYYQGSTFTVNSISPGTDIRVPFDRVLLTQSLRYLENLYDLIGVISPDSDLPFAYFAISQDQNFHYNEYDSVPAYGTIRSLITRAYDGSNNGRFVDVGPTNPNTSIDCHWPAVRGMRKLILNIKASGSGTISDTIDIYPYYTPDYSVDAFNMALDASTLGANVFKIASNDALKGVSFNTGTEFSLVVDVSGMDGYIAYQINNSGTSNRSRYLMTWRIVF